MPTRASNFLIYAGDGGAQLDFAIQTDDVGGLSDAVTVQAPANAWTQVRIALTDLGDPGVIQRLNWQDATGAVQPTFYLDDIRFIDVNATPTLVADTPTPTPVATEAPIAGHITIDARVAGTPFDAANMTGTNLAAWINAPLMASDTLRAPDDGCGQRARCAFRAAVEPGIRLAQLRDGQRRGRSASLPRTVRRPPHRFPRLPARHQPARHVHHQHQHHAAGGRSRGRILQRDGE
ncbi:MAG: hypothetical protein R2851_08300 [Caldilineaceae bacterium]